MQNNCESCDALSAMFIGVAWALIWIFIGFEAVFIVLVVCLVGYLLYKLCQFVCFLVWEGLRLRQLTEYLFKMTDGPAPINPRFLGLMDYIWIGFMVPIVIAVVGVNLFS
jgi:hypothetical protein